jgi:FAD/FMN-containing dehydrogenase
LLQDVTMDSSTPTTEARGPAPRPQSLAAAPWPTFPHHDAKVARIIAQLRRHDGSRPVSLRKRSVSHQVPKANDQRRHDAKIDIGDLTEILLIDPVRRICIAESGVTFVELVAATLRHGLVPIVVPELKTITIGGAVSGCSIESMSWKRGGFHDTCLEYEVITATGTVLVCRPENEYRNVFEMIHGSFGTLGILSRLVFELVPAKRFVKIAYETYPELAEFQAAITRHAEAADLDFMDGIIHSPSRYVLAVGRFVDDAPYTSRYDWLKVYYRSTAERTEDYLETPDYFFRYDRGVTNVRPQSFLGRLLFGKFMTSTRWLWLGDKLHWLLRTDRPTVTVDVFVPVSQVPAFMTWYQQEIGFFPLWCVPYRRVRDYPWLHDAYWANLPDQMFLDLAIYGLRQRGPVNVHRMIEAKLRELGGIKTLISHNYYSPQEFWSIWNARTYDAVKAITDPDNVFRDLYAKTCKAAMGEGPGG